MSLFFEEKQIWNGTMLEYEKVSDLKSWAIFSIFFILMCIGILINGFGKDDKPEKCFIPDGKGSYHYICTERDYSDRF